MGITDVLSDVHLQELQPFFKRQGRQEAQDRQDNSFLRLGVWRLALRALDDISEHRTYRVAMLAHIEQFVRWIASHGHIALLAVLLIVGGTWGFVALLDEVREGDTSASTSASCVSSGHIADRLGSGSWPRPHRAGWHDCALDDHAIHCGLSIYRAKVSRDVVLVLISTTTGLLVSSVLKHFTDLARPELFEHRSYVYTTSFPSGHSMMSAIVYLTLGSLLDAGWCRDAGSRSISSRSHCS